MTASLRSPLLEVDGFRYVASITPLARPAGRFSLEISSTWARARRPDEPRRVLQLDLDADGLRALHALTAAALRADGEEA